MNRAQRRLCLSIVRSLAAHPAARPFRAPVNLEEFPTYLEVIDDPMDLGTIETRLRGSEYRSVREFKRDMALIWENCYAFAGAGSWAAVLANHVKALFERKMLKMSTTNLEGWLSKASELKDELNKSMENPPSDVAKRAPLEMLARKELQPFTPQEFEDLFRAASTLSEEDRVKAMKDLGNAKGPVELTLLPLDKLHEVRKFVTEKTPQVKKRAMMGFATVANHDM